MTVGHRLRSDWRFVAGAAILTGLIVIALLAPLLTHADPTAQPETLGSRLLPPFSVGPDGARHLFGTDALGRDVWARLVYGARISLIVGVLAVGAAILLGTAIGVIAAAAGGRTERVLMAVTDAALAMPRLVLLLALVSIWHPSTILVVLVLGVTGWMGVARLTRAEVKSLLARPFVEAAWAAGIGRPRGLLRHVLPNAMTPIIVAAALGVGNAIMLEAGLSFLGLGIPAPAPSWGNMIAAGRDAMVNAPWAATIPGLAIVLTVVACNLVGDGVQDALNPAASDGH